MTYHGPGQLVAYPLLDLRLIKQDVHWYMRSIEQVIINSLAEFGIEAQRREGLTGVWVWSKELKSFRKIASIGVRISRWCTLHGFAINLADCTEGFSVIQPCGLRDARVTSVAQENRLKRS